MAETGNARWRNATEKMVMEKEFLDAINESREKKRRSMKLKKMCKNALKFLLSTGGLLLLNGVYLVIGAYIFSHLEKTNEIEGCRNARNDYQEAENATLILLMDMAQRLDGVGALSGNAHTETYNEFKDYLKSFALSVLDTGYDVSLDCDNLEIDDKDLDWRWTGSFVFAITVVTTIGYGHIAPQTFWGRLVCIAYATLGIPIFLMYLGNIGEVLANIFRITYSTVCCCGCCRKKEPPEKSEEQLAKEEDDARKAMAVWRTDASGKPIPPTEDDIPDEDVDILEEDVEEEELTVPLTITLVVWAGFIVLGAALFSYWEDQWDFTISAYYCYTTLTTIGFGDYVPGIDLTNASSFFKSLAAVMYIFFGMAAVSMCIQLIADEVVAKIKWIGEKVSGKKKDGEEEENKDDDANDDFDDGITDLENGK